ncbi:hypothetical protein D8I24_2642 (plasmid) [Cupriavidus necator H850]|nr:hypothetical protein D8I24_2642 [Cupriavidus necator H850]
MDMQMRLTECTDYSLRYVAVHPDELVTGQEKPSVSPRTI